jgi:hypothetical protein
MTIFGSQVSIVVFISALASFITAVGGAVTEFAQTFPGTIGKVVSMVMLVVGIIALAWTAFIHTVDTAAGQPSPDPTK